MVASGADGILATYDQPKYPELLHKLESMKKHLCWNPPLSPKLVTS